MLPPAIHNFSAGHFTLYSIFPTDNSCVRLAVIKRSSSWSGACVLGASGHKTELFLPTFTHQTHRPQRVQGSASFRKFQL